jgi:hypothetical protein
MEIYVPEAVAQDIIAISKSFHVDAQIVGRVVKQPILKLTISSKYGILNINIIRSDPFLHYIFVFLKKRTQGYRYQG